MPAALLGAATVRGLLTVAGRALGVQRRGGWPSGRVGAPGVLREARARRCRQCRRRCADGGTLDAGRPTSAAEVLTGNDGRGKPGQRRRGDERPFPCGRNPLPGRVLGAARSELDADHRPPGRRWLGLGRDADRLQLRRAPRRRDGAAPRLHSGGRLLQPDCDEIPVPVPAGGAPRGPSSYACDTSRNDCHLLVYQGRRLYELYQANIAGGLASGSPFTTVCAVVWDLDRDYWRPATPYSRGDQCTSADAAGLPIAPLLVTGRRAPGGRRPARPALHPPQPQDGQRGVRASGDPRRWPER